MNGRLLTSLPCFCLLTILCAIGGCQKKEDVLQDMIRGGQSVRQNVLRDGGGVYSDYKVYRDGQNDGVVYEYIFAPDAIVDTNLLTPQKIKQEMATQMSSEPNTKRVLAMGIYLRLIYKRHDGQVLCEVKMTADDF